VEERSIFPDYLSRHYLDYTVLYPESRISRPFARRANGMAVLTNKPVRMSQASSIGLGVGSHSFSLLRQRLPFKNPIRSLKR